MIKIQYVGHSSLYIKSKYKILIDPYLKGYGIEGLTEYNPNAALWAEQVNPDMILITHGHGDHFGQTIKILKRKSAIVIASTKICSFLKGKLNSIQCLPIEPGEVVKQKGVKIKAVKASHRFNLEGIIGDLFGTLNYNQYIPCGTNMGFIIDVENTKIYHSGDTKEVADIKNPDIAFMSMDGFRTMNYEEVLSGIKQIKPQIVIPIHYRWNPLGKKVANQVKTGITRNNLDSMFIPLENGEILE